MTNSSKVSYLDPNSDSSIAYHATSGKSPGIIFFGGFMSDMSGTKATALESFARAEGQAYTRFDYSGHGLSGGKFVDGTISRWRDDALAVLDKVTAGPQVLVGSSMGGWLALLCALARPDRVRGLVLIAPAPDFTDKLMWPEFSEQERATIMRDGALYQPSEYSEEPYVITRDLIEDGREHNLLDGTIEIDCPVRILHGMKDVDVPWQWSLKIAECLSSEDVQISFSKSGDHRLSTSADIERLCAAVRDLP